MYIMHSQCAFFFIVSGSLYFIKRVAPWVTLPTGSVGWIHLRAATLSEQCHARLPKKGPAQARSFAQRWWVFFPPLIRPRRYTGSGSTAWSQGRLASRCCVRRLRRQFRLSRWSCGWGSICFTHKLFIHLFQIILLFILVLLILLWLLLPLHDLNSKRTHP